MVYFNEFFLSTSLILVSHDLTLLEKSVNNIAEVIGKTVITYGSCNYPKYLEAKEFRAKSAQAEYERNMEEAARLQAFVDRFGASATKAASAQSRVKMLEKMKKEGKLVSRYSLYYSRDGWMDCLAFPL